MKTFFCSCFFFLGLVLHAQTEQHQILIDAKSNLNFINNASSSSSDNERDYQFTMQLQGGYAVVKNLFVGPLIDYTQFKFEDSEPTYRTLHLGVFTKYFFNFYEQPSVLPYVYTSYSLTNDKISDFQLPGFKSGTSLTERASRFELGAGLSFFVLPEALSLDLNLGYIRFGEALLQSIDRVFYFNAGFSIFL